MAFARVALLLCALPFTGPGLFFLLLPDEAAQVVDVALASPLAQSDARSVFGALELGVAVVLALAATRTAWLVPGLSAAAILYGALVSGRFLSLALDGSPGAIGYALLVPELLCLALALAALRRARARS